MWRLEIPVARYFVIISAILAAMLPAPAAAVKLSLPKKLPELPKKLPDPTHPGSLIPDSSKPGSPSSPIPGPLISNSPIPLPPAAKEALDKLGAKEKETAGAVVKLGDDTFATLQTAAGDSVRTLEKAGGDTLTTVKKAGADGVNTVTKAAGDATASYVKAWRDVGDQSKRSFKDVIDAGKAAARFAENQAKSEGTAAISAKKRLRDGKIIDSIWGLGTEPAKSAEQNFAKATEESDLLNTAAASAAAVYGGPAGAAAYAAWSTYRRTGDANLALRAGIVAGVTSEMGNSVATLPAGTTGEIIKKAALAGAAGGIAVAAAGGDEQAIKDGFLKSAGTVLIQGGNDKLKAYSPQLKDAYDTVQCISARDVDCLSNTTWARDAKGKMLYDPNGKPRVDPSALDPEQYVGNWTGLDQNSDEGKKNAFITQVSKLPDTEAVPLLHNNWVLTWKLGDGKEIQYKSPTVVLTYVGKAAPFTSTTVYGGSAVSSLDSKQSAAESHPQAKNTTPGPGAKPLTKGETNSKRVRMFTVELQDMPGSIRHYKQRAGGSWTRKNSEDGKVSRWQAEARITLDGCTGQTLVMLPINPGTRYEVFVPDKSCPAMIAKSRLEGTDWRVMGAMKDIK
ncbi:hypothetical protein GCM10007881_65930 [Mesorhizobium huakuii]|uniref:hypothetical protein n=1 Tax=Mesorhizobium huakuii TaxID=28104 RepID=UPI00235C26BF|nr:hypothetical protein [Mesorhizobium huakuii]GLQ83070.1 hypothetical protein GCM10007881_65930 [Mesorhizobium huakuii]